MSLAPSISALPQASGTAVASPAAASRVRPALPVLAMVGGLVALTVAATMLVAQTASHHRAGSAAPAAVAAPAPTDPLAITLSARDVSVVTQVYEPGQESGWHMHAGIHAVAVISGTLTVYEADCQPHVVDPTRPWVGGQTPHLVRNETSEPVVMTVTYLSPSAPTNSTRRVDTPVGCEVPS